MTEKVYICNAKRSVRCKYKRNIKPISEKTGCGYDGECGLKSELYATDSERQTTIERKGGK